MAFSLRKSSDRGSVGLDIDGRYLAAAQVSGGRVTHASSQGLPEGLVRDGEVLVVCEVKTRVSDACGTPHEAVTADKLERLQRLALLWADAHDLSPADVRIDLVAVHRPRRGPAAVEHVAGLV